VSGLAPHAQRPEDYEQKERAVLEAAVAWLAALDARGEAWVAYRESRGTGGAWEAFRVAEVREREATLAAAAAVRDLAAKLRAWALAEVPRG
jgi:hypothetical protein